jgi:hypothetical protein
MADEVTGAREGSPELVTTVLLLTCHEVEEVEVAFEPEGMLHTLRKGDLFRVEVVLPAGREIEIDYGPDGKMAIWAEQTWGTRAFNKAGEPLQL